MDRIEAGKPRVIRKVTCVYKAGSMKGCSKIAKDRKTLYYIEQIRARTPHPCKGLCVGWIEKDTYYAQLTAPHLYRFVGRRRVPRPEAYHFECLPSVAQPLARFFRQ